MSRKVRAEMLEAYGDALASAWPQLLMLALLPLLAWGGYRALGRARARAGRGVEGAARSVAVAHVVAGLAVVVGLVLSHSRAACFDDAFISFRYAQNLVDGHGLVFNSGERVEGYTNFLWTLLVALLIPLTGLEAPLLGVALAMASFAANLLVVHRISLHLRPADAPALPIAVVLFALQNTAVSYGTSGLETMFASLLVNLGLLQLVRDQNARSRGLAGLWLILATLTRPDHALFYACGAAVVALDGWRALRQGGGASWVGAVRRFVAVCLPYALPFVLYLAHLAFRIAYYGETLPNTYYAKLASEPDYRQGWVYAWTFYLASHFWLVVPMWLGGVVLGLRAGGRLARFALFSLVAALSYDVYVARVGGDFMHGRFYLSLIPLYLLGAERLVVALAGRAGLAGALAAGLLLATAQGVRLYDERAVRWQITDEGSHYRITSWFPIVVDNYSYNAGKVLQRMREAGARPVVASTTVGMIGYYSGLTVIDKYGLTDHHIARLPAKRRRRPGHVLRDSTRYLQLRQVDIARREAPAKPYRSLARIQLGPNTGGDHWYLMRYDAELIARIRAGVPQVRVTDFVGYLDRRLDRLEQGTLELSRAEMKRDVAFYEAYYFAANDDPTRLARVRRLMAPAAGDGPVPGQPRP